MAIFFIVGYIPSDAFLWERSGDSLVETSFLEKGSLYKIKEYINWGCSVVDLEKTRIVYKI